MLHRAALSCDVGVLFLPSGRWYIQLVAALAVLIAAIGDVAQQSNHIRGDTFDMNAVLHLSLFWLFLLLFVFIVVVVTLPSSLTVCHMLQASAAGEALQQHEEQQQPQQERHQQ